MASQTLENVEAESVLIVGELTLCTFTIDYSFISRVNRIRASSMSYLRVDCVFFWKDVQAPHRVLQARCKDDTKSACFIPDANLLYAPADRRHRLEIIGLLASLDIVELISRILPGVLGKLP